jgi:hypothetical protein
MLYAIVENFGDFFFFPKKHEICDRRFLWPNIFHKMEKICHQKNHCVKFPFFLSNNITFYNVRIYYEILTGLHKLGNFSLYIWKAHYTCEWIFKIERIIHLLFKNGKLICHKIPPTIKK